MKNVFLLFMILSYMIPIYIVYNDYTEETSVSCILQKHVEIILISMISMGFWTVLYEWNQPTFYSICTLLVGIYGVILTPEVWIIHYIFGIMVVLSILFYMIYKTIFTKSNILILLLCLECLSIMGCIIDMDRDIFLWEVGFIGIFGIFYLLVFIKGLESTEK
jgi:hypothetical protein